MFHLDTVNLRIMDIYITIISISSTDLESLQILCFMEVKICYNSVAMVIDSTICDVSLSFIVLFTRACVCVCVRACVCVRVCARICVSLCVYT